MGTTLSVGILAQPAAEVETVAAGNHDVQQKQRGRLPLGVAKYLPIARYGRTVNPALSRWYCTSREISTSSSSTKIV
jgi:hypothetical protein